MSTLTESTELAAEVSTGARKKNNKKVKISRKDEVETARDQLEALHLRPPLTNGTSERSAESPAAASESASIVAGDSSSPCVYSVQLPSILTVNAHSEHCTERSCASNLHLLENLEDALENLEADLKEQRAASETVRQDDIQFVCYESELQMPEIMRLIQKDLSEPYSIYTYRYFIHNWPKLCFLAMHESRCIGAIVCKLDLHRNVLRGYIAMLAVDEQYRKRKIGSRLVRQAIQAMIQDNADEVVLETEITNKPALRLYENLGFVRDKRLFRYYLNGVDALRLKLWLR